MFDISDPILVIHVQTARGQERHKRQDDHVYYLSMRAMS